MARLILAGLTHRSADRSAEGWIVELALAGMTQHHSAYQDTISLSSRPVQAYSKGGNRAPRDSSGAQGSSIGLGSELAHNYFRHISLAKASHKASPDSRRGGIVSMS